MQTIHKIHRTKGFTLLEVLTVTAIIGILMSVAVPYMQSYAVRAQVTEGVMLIAELRRRIEVEFYERGALTTDIPASPTPDGSIFGGPWYSYETMFGEVHDMWESIEYQPKGPHRVIVLRAHRKPEWQNSDIGLHMQVKLVNDERLEYRCTVNNTQSRMQFVPSSCQEGNVNDWVSW